MSNYPTLQQEFTAVIDNLKGREWIQGEEQRPDGAVCAHGAVMTCQGLRPGDAHIIRAVMRTKGLTEGWNDQSGRTKDEVERIWGSIAEGKVAYVSTDHAPWPRHRPPAPAANECRLRRRPAGGC